MDCLPDVCLRLSGERGRCGAVTPAVRQARYRCCVCMPAGPMALGQLGYLSLKGRRVASSIQLGIRQRGFHGAAQTALRYGPITANNLAPMAQSGAPFYLGCS